MLPPEPHALDYAHDRPDSDWPYLLIMGCGYVVILAVMLAFTVLGIWLD
jgi:hypothetical protein